MVNALSVRYTVEGQGPDVVFIHGWASSSRMWAEFSTRLAERYRCWSLDLPGCGDSDKPGGHWYSIPNFTSTVHTFLDLHGLERVRLVGHSMGGMIVLNLAARHPGLVSRLVAINPVVTGNANLRHLARPAVSGRLLHWALRLSPVVLQPLLAHPLGGRVNGLHHIRRRTEDFVKGTPESLLSSGRAVMAFDVSPLLARITAPTLVIVGDRDLNVPTSEGRLAADKIPAAELHVLRGGHLVTDDRPGEILDRLQGFFA